MNTLIATGRLSDGEMAGNLLDRVKKCALSGLLRFEMLPDFSINVYYSLSIADDNFYRVAFAGMLRNWGLDKNFTIYPVAPDCSRLKSGQEAIIMTS